jgi:hypothetical protein
VYDEAYNCNHTFNLIFLIGHGTGPQRAARLKAILAFSTLAAYQGRLGPQRNRKELPGELRCLAQGQPALPLAAAGCFLGGHLSQHCLDGLEHLKTFFRLYGISLKEKTKGNTYPGRDAAHPPKAANSAGHRLAPGQGGTEHLGRDLASQVTVRGQDNGGHQDVVFRTVAGDGRVLADLVEEGKEIRFLGCLTEVLDNGQPIGGVAGIADKVALLTDRVGREGGLTIMTGNGAFHFLVHQGGTTHHTAGVVA